MERNLLDAVHVHKRVVQDMSWLNEKIELKNEIIEQVKERLNENKAHYRTMIDERIAWKNEVIEQMKATVEQLKERLNENKAHYRTMIDEKNRSMEWVKANAEIRLKDKDIRIQEIRDTWKTEKEMWSTMLQQALKQNGMIEYSDRRRTEGRDASRKVTNCHSFFHFFPSIYLNHSVTESMDGDPECR